MENLLEDQHLVLVDGYGFIFRAYHAVPPLIRSDGINVGAVYGFTSMLMKLIDEINATHISIIFDTGGKNFRNDLYKEYKSHRKPVPDDLIPQFAIIREAVKALNLHTIESIGYEADDIIATIAKSDSFNCKKVTIVSSDKDLMQLIDDRISMFDAMKSKIITEREVIDKWGVVPKKIIDLFALIGDSSDNIPGIAGIGPKTALELINEFNSIEELYDRIDEIKQSKRKDNIVNNKELAFLSKKLVALYDKIPIESDLNALKVKNVDIDIFREFLEKQNFKSLLKRAENQFKTENDEPKKFDIKSIDDNHIIINNLDDLIDFCQKIRSSNSVSIFTQTTIIDNIKIIKYISLSTIDQTCCIIVKNDQLIVEDDLMSFNLNQIINLLRPILADESINKIFFDFKSFVHLIGNIEVNSVNDIMLMSYNILGTSITIDLENIISHYFGVDLTKLDLSKKKSVGQIDQIELINYIAIRSKYIFELYKILSSILFNDHLLTVYEKIERPLSIVLYEMEKEGIRIDQKKLESLSAEFSKKIINLENQIFTITKKEFNLASPKQLGQILFEEMKLPTKKITKTGNYKTGADILEDLSNKGYHIAELILEWRGFSKLKSTYTDSLIEQIDKNTSRIHTNFMMTSTATGRLSSTDPNLQNIPVRSDEGNKIRSCFIAKPGYKLISADYSQIELRLLAHIADISALKDAFKNNKDIHTATAISIFNVSEDRVDSNMRRKAKAINFGIIYGISSFGLAKQLSISRIEAQNYIDAYFEKYPGIESYMKDLKNFAKENGYVKTMYGRKCFVLGINDSNQNIRSMAERAAINAPIQGVAADIIKISMIRIQNYLKENNIDAKMLLQVHDELVFEVKDGLENQLSNTIKNIMENVIRLDVPLEVSIGIGNNWSIIH